MNAPKNFIYSIRIYFLIFAVFSTSVLLLINYKLYSEGENIRQAVEAKNQEKADQEMERILETSLNQLQQKVDTISEWDEVFQQLRDPSYYFFWHDERMQESRYFHPSFTNLELYNSQRKLLMPSSPTKGYQSFLPQQLDDLAPKLIFKPFNPIHLNLYSPIYQRGSREVIGYVGVSIDFMYYLLRENNFFYIDKSSIQFHGEGLVPVSEMKSQLHYQPLKNSVSEELWGLIKRFIWELIALLAFMSVVMNFLFNLMIYSPIQLLANYVSQLKKHSGELPPPDKRFFLKEFEKLKLSIYDYHRNLHRTQAELDRQNQIVWDQARRDVLTSIYNRRAFDEAWNDVLHRYAQEPIPTAFMLFDCDFFKALNDTYGHEIGDEVIRGVCQGSCRLVSKSTQPDFLYQG